MDYQKVYNQIIERGRVREVISPIDGYKEKHHIVPRCLNGKDTKENIVELTGREHFICHWLLHRLYPDSRKLAYAFYAMTCFSNNSYQHRYTPSSRAISEAKEAASKSKKGVSYEEKLGTERASILKAYQSKSRKGRKPWNKGQKATDTARKNMSTAQRNRYKNDSGTFKGRTHSKEARLKMRTAKLGKYKGRNSPSYGSGKLIQEISTGYIGTVTDMMVKFDIKDNGSIYSNIKRGVPFVKGKNKGLWFKYTPLVNK